MINKAKIRWGCRRGMLELDLILLPFFERHFDNLTLTQKEEFVELLNVEDAFLFSWLMGHEPVTENLQEIVKKVSQTKLFNH
jgi:antitoxin CptB